MVRWSGVSSGLPARRASSCAPATASCDLRVSRLKSMSTSPGGMLRGPVEHELALVRLVDGRDLGPQLVLEPLHTSPQPLELVLETEHVLDPGEVEAELGRQPLDE